ncbi:MAG: SDR family oxidoreductase, partial [Myxococcota bacterium]
CALPILVNNAQRAPLKPVPILEHTDEIFDLCFDTGLRGTFYFMRACHPYLKTRGGRIINVGSGAGLDGMAGQGAYGAAKEAIRALSKTAAREWGADGINVNIICPLAKSPGVAALIENAPEMEARMTKGQPIQRIGDCEEDIGPVVVFLASEDARYVTGQTIPVDGGSVMIR